MRKVRGRPFTRGKSAGRLDLRNRITQLVEQLAGRAEKLIQKAVDLAQAGDVSCLRMLLDRLWPPRKGQPVNVVMPPINTTQDVFPAIASIWTAIGEGRLTPDEASALADQLSTAPCKRSNSMILQSVSLLLEKARDKRDEKSNS